MTDIQQFSLPITFDAETTALLGAAYDKVIAGMHDLGRPVSRELIAEHIIELAAKGERDIDELCRGTLAWLGLSQEECQRLNGSAGRRTARTTRS